MNQNETRTKIIQYAREASFTQPIHTKFNFKRVTTDEFWDVYEKDFHHHSPLDLFFDEEKLRSKFESENLNLLSEQSLEKLLEDNYLLLDEKGLVIAMMRGWQKSYDSYYMQFTAVHTDFRKQGLYSALIDRILLYTSRLGFSRVLSCHAPFNNAVLIAKLKKDFKVVGMDIDPALGINILLCYFHNQELKRAFELRCGKLTFSENLSSASLGTIQTLSNLIK